MRQKLKSLNHGSCFVGSFLMPLDPALIISSSTAFHSRVTLLWILLLDGDPGRSNVRDGERPFAFKR